ncbi:MAG: hypothetical protein C5B53_07085 [Candidatus Melainabacteria bacterium]|nr:MAG: hypothetical protein C5B53_07085 [Candidatus Melainabacteria bacterium]
MGQTERDLNRPNPAADGESALIGQLLPKAAGRRQDIGNDWERTCLLSLMAPCLVPIPEKTETANPEDWKVSNEEFKTNVTKWGRDAGLFERWQTRYRVDHDRYPSMEQEAKFLKAAELVNYPYNEGMVKGWVHDVMTNGQRYAREDFWQRDASRRAALHLSETCRMLADMGDERAEKMVKPMAVAMQTTNDPIARDHLVSGLGYLVNRGVISQDQYQKMLVDAMRSDLKNTSPYKGKLDFIFEDREKTLVGMARLLNRHRTPEVERLFNEIAADEKCVVPELRETIQGLLNPKPNGT